jgi:hypothetical protein
MQDRKTGELQLALKYKEIQGIKSQLDLMQLQVQALISPLGNMTDQNQINNFAQNLYGSRYSENISL